MIQLSQHLSLFKGRFKLTSYKINLQNQEESSVLNV